MNTKINLFQQHPQFIKTDTDIRRGQGGFNVTAEFLSTRYNILLPPNTLQGKTVLDLGCTVAAAGAWVLGHGAAEYVGVELQKKLSDASIQNLTESFPDDNWKILEVSIEKFLESNTQKFDVVIATGILHTSINYQKLIDQVVAIADTVVYDLRQSPFFVANIDFSILLHMNKVTNPELIPFTYYRTDAEMVHEDGYKVYVPAALPSLGAVKLLFKQHGFEMDFTSYNQLKEQLPEIYNITRRSGCIFNKKSPPTANNFEDIYCGT